MTPIKTATDMNYGALPIVRPSFSEGQKIDAVAENAASVVAARSGAYVLTPTVNVMLCIGSNASTDAGSIYLAAGSAYHTIASQGERISVIATDDAGTVYIAPLA